MKPPRPNESDATGTESPLVEVSTALAAGRLADLLRGNGLTRKTVEELLRPESAATLRSILTEHVCAPEGAHDPGLGHECDPFPSGGGKVLAFKAKETLRGSRSCDSGCERKAENPIAKDE